MSKPILVFGTVVIDRVRKIDQLPLPGGYAEFRDEQWFLGGEAANTAVALAKWGVDVVLLGNSLGGSSESQWLQEQLRLAGVDPCHCEALPGPAPTCDIYLAPDGCRTMFGTSWPDGEVNMPEMEAGWITVDPNRKGKSRRAVQWAKRQGLSVYAMDFLPSDLELGEGDYFQLSSRMMGSASEDSLVALVEELSQQTAATVIVTRGKLPSVIGKSGVVSQYPGFRSAKVVDTTGAGDCFRAGMLFGLKRGWGLGECVCFASSAASLKCESLGATSGLPSEEQVRRRMNEPG